MKAAFALLIYILSLSSFATTAYPVKNFNYINEMDFASEVQNDDRFVVMVFSSKQCLERVNVDRNCWLFEKKLDYFVPRFHSKVKVVGLNTYFENEYLTSIFRVTKIPTVIIYYQGQELERLEANYTYGDWQSGNWQDQLLSKVLDKVSRIR